MCIEVMGFPSRLLRAIMMDCNGAYKRAFGVPFVGQRWTRTTRGESTGNDHYHYTQFCREIIIELVLPRLPRVLHTATSSRTTKRKSIRANSKHTKRSSSNGRLLVSPARTAGPFGFHNDGCLNCRGKRADSVLSS